MHSITNLLFDKVYFQPFEDNKRASQITSIAVGTLLTSALAISVFCAIFFTTHLFIPAFVVSVSLVLLSCTIDLTLVVYNRKKNIASDTGDVIEPKTLNTPPETEADLEEQAKQVESENDQAEIEVLTKVKIPEIENEDLNALTHEGLLKALKDLTTEDLKGLGLTREAINKMTREEILFIVLAGAVVGRATAKDGPKL